MGKSLTDPIFLYENYVKILFIYNKLDLIIKFSEYMSYEHKKLLNLNSIILFLEKKYKRLIFLNKLISYFAKYFVSKDFSPHWKI